MHNPLIHPLLPLRSCIVTLRWLSASQPGFLHNVPLHAWIRTLAGSPDNFSDYMIVEPLENGHIHYRKGDGYRFRLTALSGGEALLGTLLKKLQTLPESVSKKKANQAFTNNLELVSIEDTLERHKVTDVAELTCFDENALWLETALWARQPWFKIAFTTPARLIKAKDDQDSEEKPTSGANIPKGKQRFCRDKTHLTWPLITQRVTDTLINLYQRRTGERLQRAPWPEAKVHNALAFWVDHSYSKNTDGSRKDASGLLAHLQVSLAPEFPSELLALLVLGQYIGIGQNRSFGMGQYQLLDQYNEATYPRPSAIQSLLQKALQDSNLSQACDVMYGRQSNLSKEGTNEADDHLKSEHFIQLQAQRKRIESKDYIPSPLQPMEIDKPDGGTRLLSIPSWQDRTLQRAVADVLGPTLDQLWMKHSYGYRKGHSRLNARDQINRHIQQGYKWVLESDIESFFDTVCWQNLEQRLTLLFPNEPLVPLLMQWITCQREENEIDTRVRIKGLPQGAPVSPLLANLLLDDLDQDMIAKGHNIIRYADDFVLLFKTEQEAKSALPDIQASLHEHDLSINSNKTRIVQAESGFRYLGYLFIDGYAIEATRTDHREEQEHAETFKPLAKTPSKEAIGERRNLGTLLVVAGDLAMLFNEKNRLVVEQYDEKHSYCWSSLMAVLLVGPHQITTPALRAAMANEVPIHFASSFGRYQGVASSQEPNHLGANFWLLQTQYLQQESKALEISRELVRARLAGQSAFIQRREKNAPELDRYHRIAEKITHTGDINQLRGYESESAKLLWSFIKRHLDPEWRFTGRNRRPPKDPVNAMLSLGYSFLYSLIDSINHLVGLYPWQGAFHQNKGRHKTLSSDLMEPYRYIVERVVMTLINRSQIKPHDFSETDQGCQMSSEARKTLLNELLIQLTKQSTNSPSIIDGMKEQALSLALSCKTGQRFQAWRPKK